MKPTLVLTICILLYAHSINAQDWASKYDKVIEADYEGGAYVVEKNGKFGACTYHGVEILPVEYDEVMPCINRWDGHHEFSNGFNENGLAVFRKGHKWGMIDTTGAIIIPFEYDRIGSPHGYWLIDRGLIGVQKGKKWGMVDSTGALHIDIKYKCLGFDDCTPYFDEGWMAFSNNEKKSNGFIDHEGHETIWQNEYFEVEILKGGYMLVWNGAWGVVNNKGEMIVPNIYSEIKPDVEDDGTVNYFEAYDESTETYIDFDLTGKEIKS